MPLVGERDLRIERAPRKEHKQPFALSSVKVIELPQVGHRSHVSRGEKV